MDGGRAAAAVVAALRVEVVERLKGEMAAVTGVATHCPGGRCMGKPQVDGGTRLANALAFLHRAQHVVGVGEGAVEQDLVDAVVLEREVRAKLGDHMHTGPSARRQPQGARPSRAIAEV